MSQFAGWSCDLDPLADYRKTQEFQEYGKGSKSPDKGLEHQNSHVQWAWQLTADPCVSTMGSHTTWPQRLKDGQVSVLKFRTKYPKVIKRCLWDWSTELLARRPVLIEAEKALGAARATCPSCPRLPPLLCLCSSSSSHCDTCFLPGSTGWVRIRSSHES